MSLFASPVIVVADAMPSHHGGLCCQEHASQMTHCELHIYAKYPERVVLFRSISLPIIGDGALDGDDVSR